MGDGYTPKSKLASTEAIAGGLQLISTSPVLQAAYGPSLPGMFAHLMSLQGVKGLEEYDPINQQQQQGVKGPVPLNGSPVPGATNTDPALAAVVPGALPAPQNMPTMIP